MSIHLEYDEILFEIVMEYNIPERNKDSFIRKYHYARHRIGINRDHVLSNLDTSVVPVIPTALMATAFIKSIIDRKLHLKDLSSQKEAVDKLITDATQEIINNPKEREKLLRAVNEGINKIMSDGPITSYSHIAKYIDKRLPDWLKSSSDHFVNPTILGLLFRPISGIDGFLSNVPIIKYIWFIPSSTTKFVLRKTGLMELFINASEVSQLQATTLSVLKLGGKILIPSIIINLAVYNYLCKILIRVVEHSETIPGRGLVTQRNYFLNLVVVEYQVPTKLEFSIPVIKILLLVVQIRSTLSILVLLA